MLLAIDAGNTSVTVGLFLLMLLVACVAFVLTVIAGIKANNGEWWTPPLTPQLVK